MFEHVHFIAIAGYFNINTPSTNFIQAQILAGEFMAIRQIHQSFTLPTFPSIMVIIGHRSYAS